MRLRYVFSLQVPRKICDAVSWAIDLFSCTSRSLQSFSAHAHAVTTMRAMARPWGLRGVIRNAKPGSHLFQASCQAPLATKK